MRKRWEVEVKPQFLSFSNLEEANFSVNLHRILTTIILDVDHFLIQVLFKHSDVHVVGMAAW